MCFSILERNYAIVVQDDRPAEDRVPRPRPTADIVSICASKRRTTNDETSLHTMASHLLLYFRRHQRESHGSCEVLLVLSRQQQKVGHADIAIEARRLLVCTMAATRSESLKTMVYSSEHGTEYQVAKCTSYTPFRLSFVIKALANSL